MQKSKVTILAAAFAALSLGAFVACGDEKATPAPVAAKAPEAVVKAPEPVKAAPVPVKVEVKASPAAADGLSGVVKIKGEVPRRKKINMANDPKCAAMHPEAPLNEEVVADKDGNVQWAFVYVKKGAEGKKGPAPKALTINQVGCHYEPHVAGVMTGQEFTVMNSDETLHNIHAVPFNNKEFNFGQPQKGMTEKKVFTTVEVMVKVKCDVHAWMGAWIGVLDHPFFAVTDASGKFTIEGLPDGKYTVEAWHEKYKSVSADVEVKGATTANFELVDKKE